MKAFKEWIVLIVGIPLVTLLWFGAGQLGHFLTGWDSDDSIKLMFIILAVVVAIGLLFSRHKYTRPSLEISLFSLLTAVYHTVQLATKYVPGWGIYTGRHVELGLMLAVPVFLLYAIAWKLTARNTPIKTPKE